jgi:N-acetylglucosaminyl-diphospho-decaprenol L-rhamnosyltransferase
MKLLVIVVSYKVTDLTIECLRSLSREIHRVPGARVAVCENGTGEDAEARLRRAIDDNGWGDWVDLTAIHPNRGFTGGNNVIIRAALASADPPDYFLLLNADTVLEPHSLDTLVDFMDQNPQVGIAGSLLLNPDRSIQGCVYRFPGIASEFERNLRIGPVSHLLSRWTVRIDTPRLPSPADWVPGCSMIIRRQAVEAIGPLDEGLYTYFDDIDYCLNARRAGWPTWFVPASCVVHLEGASTGVTARVVKRRPAYWFQARRRFFLRNHGAIYTAMVDAAAIIGLALWRLRRWVQRKPDDDPPHMLMDLIRNSVFCTGFAVRIVENPAMKQFQQCPASA